MTTQTIQIFHNPRCSKSRGSLEVLNQFIQQHPEYAIEEIRYLQTPPNDRTLKTLCNALGLDAFDLIRTKETLFKELGFTQQDKDKYLDDHWLTLMAENPKLIERPIIKFKDKAVIGRPPEKVTEFLDSNLL